MYYKQRDGEGCRVSREAGGWGKCGGTAGKGQGQS